MGGHLRLQQTVAKRRSSVDILLRCKSYFQLHISWHLLSTCFKLESSPKQMVKIATLSPLTGYPAQTQAAACLYKNLRGEIVAISSIDLTSSLSLSLSVPSCVLCPFANSVSHCPIFAFSSSSSSSFAASSLFAPLPFPPLSLLPSSAVSFFRLHLLPPVIIFLLAPLFPQAIYTRQYRNTV